MSSIVNVRTAYKSPSSASLYTPASAKRFVAKSRHIAISASCFSVRSFSLLKSSTLFCILSASSLAFFSSRSRFVCSRRLSASTSSSNLLRLISSFRSALRVTFVNPSSGDVISSPSSSSFAFVCVHDIGSDPFPLVVVAAALLSAARRTEGSSFAFAPSSSRSFFSCFRCSSSFFLRLVVVVVVSKLSLVDAVGDDSIIISASSSSSFVVVVLVVVFSSLSSSTSQRISLTFAFKKLPRVCSSTRFSSARNSFTSASTPGVVPSSSSSSSPRRRPSCFSRRHRGHHFLVDAFFESRPTPTAATTKSTSTQSGRLTTATVVVVFPPNNALIVVVVVVVSLSLSCVQIETKKTRRAMSISSIIFFGVVVFVSRSLLYRDTEMRGFVVRGFFCLSLSRLSSLVSAQHKGRGVFCPLSNDDAQKKGGRFWWCVLRCPFHFFLKI